MLAHFYGNNPNNITPPPLFSNLKTFHFCFCKNCLDGNDLLAKTSNLNSCILANV